MIAFEIVYTYKNEIDNAGAGERNLENMNKKLKRYLFAFVIVLAVTAIGAVSYYGFSFYQFAKGIHEDNNDPLFEDKDDNTPESEKYAPPEWEGSERVNILLLGADSRGVTGNQMPRADTMMIASIDPETKNTHLFSVLRDTYFNIPGYGYTKINHSLAYGGPDLVMESVSNLMDIPIQYYVYVDFEGFIELVDAIGGIEYEVEKDMHYTTKADGPEFDINLKQGLQHMDGSKALQYVRFRHDIESDYGRTERQRKFLTALFQKMQSTQSLVKIPKILDSIEPYIETNLTVGKMLRLGTLGFNINSNQIQTVQLPADEMLKETELDNGMQVITFPEDQLRAYVQEQFKLPAATAEETDTEDAEATG